MTGALHLIQIVESAGGRFMIEGDRLGIVPATAAAPVLEELRQYKAEIIGLLETVHIPLNDPAEWRKPFAQWLDSVCVRDQQWSGGVGCLHISFCEWAKPQHKGSCNRFTFECLLRESGFLINEVAGMVLVSGLAFRLDLEVYERFQNPAPTEAAAPAPQIRRAQLHQNGVPHAGIDEARRPRK